MGQTERMKRRRGSERNGMCVASHLKDPTGIVRSISALFVSESEAVRVKGGQISGARHRRVQEDAPAMIPTTAAPAAK